MQQSVEARPRRQPLGCGRTPSALAPWWAHLTTVFVWPVPGWAWAPSTSVLGPDSSLEWAFAWFFVVEFALRFLDCTFCFVFHLYSNVCPAKHISSNTSGTISILKAYVSKVCLFLLFWIVIGGRNSLLRTANTPHPIFIV